MNRFIIAAFVLLGLVTHTHSAIAEDAAPKTYTVVIKNHLFSPATVEVPAGEKFVLIVDNQDASPEEFESHSLKREKIVKGGSSIKVNLGPLKPGTYEFFGEFHEDTAKGAIVAK